MSGTVAKVDERGQEPVDNAATWVGTKLRWNLAADDAERQALLGLAEGCPTTTVVYEIAP
ncbi:hypothetical protein [Streptomyces sp. NRRL S-378]|uniref:hypothetical protein n=1 Tax=Streptomyces sp. NRRL S-378 TaxID=1463904 RepID=UPI0004C600B4